MAEGNPPRKSVSLYPMDEEEALKRMLRVPPPAYGALHSNKGTRRFYVNETLCWSVVYQTGGGWAVMKTHRPIGGRNWKTVGDERRMFAWNEERAALDYARERAEHEDVRNGPRP